METVPGLTFDSGPHAYRFNGSPVPGVTGILHPYSGLEHVDAELLRVTAEFGTHVHQTIDLYDTGNLDRDSLDPALEAHLVVWEAFLEDTGAKVIYSEAKVYSRKHGYAGTLDKIVSWKGRNRIIDIKTGAAVPKTVGPQVQAYNRAWNEMTGQRRMPCYCCHLRPDRYTLHQLKDPRDWDIFKAALTLHRWSH